MITRRALLAGLPATALTSRMFAIDHRPKRDVGLELYSLREDMKRDIPGTLAQVRQMGFDHVEVPGLYCLTAPEFRRALDHADLKATAAVFSYEELRTNLANVQRSLDALGARWALLGWIPHNKAFRRSDVDRSSRDMNDWSAALAKSGHKFDGSGHSMTRRRILP